MCISCTEPISAIVSRNGARINYRLCFTFSSTFLALSFHSSVRMRLPQTSLTLFPVSQASDIVSSVTDIVQSAHSAKSACALSAVGNAVQKAEIVASVRSDAPKAFFFFDIDNTLYHPSKGIARLMSDKIIEYCRQMGMDEDKSRELSARYYQDYGLAIRGLVIHHEIDANDYDIRVDGALPLELSLQPDTELRQMLKNMKPDIKKWTFTNAYVRHAKRVLQLLDIEDCFDGMTFCDYLASGFNCKPDLSFFEQALTDAGYDATSHNVPVYFIDDSRINIIAAKKLGWTTIFLSAEGAVCTDADYTVEDVKDIPKVLPHLFNL